VNRFAKESIRREIKTDSDSVSTAGSIGSRASDTPLLSAGLDKPPANFRANFSLKNAKWRGEICRIRRRIEARTQIDVPGSFAANPSAKTCSANLFYKITCDTGFAQLVRRKTDKTTMPILSDFMEIINEVSSTKPDEKSAQPYKLTAICLVAPGATNRLVA